MASTIVKPTGVKRTPAPLSPIRRVQRFFRTPKGLLLLVLLVLGGLATPVEGPDRVLPSVALSVLAAMLSDLGVVRLTQQRWFFPDGALLTGLIVGLVLSPETPRYVPVVAGAVAIGSKHLFRTRMANVFNPAAFGLVAVTLRFGSGHSWWGSLPDLTPLALVVLLAAGLYIGDHLNKLPLILVFLGSYFALFTVTSFLGDPSQVAEIYRAPDLNMALFFAFFMLDDPPTSPVRYGNQCWFGLIAALVSYAVFQSFGVVYFILAGLLVANLWEAWWRVAARAASRPAA
jgi:Na+-translocating ferredoxin:NAD+ oxidoreductase RnfD subunit